MTATTLKEYLDQKYVDTDALLRMKELLIKGSEDDIQAAIKLAMLYESAEQLKHELTTVERADQKRERDNRASINR